MNAAQRDSTSGEDTNATNNVLKQESKEIPMATATSSLLFVDEEHYEPMQSEGEGCCACDCISETCCENFKRGTFILVLFLLFILFLSYLLPVAIVFCLAILARLFSISPFFCCQKSSKKVR